MAEETTAILRVEHVKRSVIGVVEVRGATEDNARSMAKEGWKRTGTGWVYTVRSGLEKGWEERTARNVVNGLWQMAVTYDVTRWVAADDEVITLAHPELAELMLSGLSGDGRERKPGTAPQSPAAATGTG